MAAARVALLTLLAAGSATGSWVEVGVRNYAAVEKYVEVVQRMDGKTITPQEMSEVSIEMESLFAPKVECQWFPGSPFQIDLKDVGANECFAAMAANLGWFQQMRSSASAIGIDPKSGGKVILTQWDDVAAGVTPSGEVAPGTSTHFPNDIVVFEFNDEGLIVRLDGSVDTGLMVGILDKVEAYAMRADLSEKAWASFSSVGCGAIACAWVAGLALGSWATRRGGRKAFEQPILG